MAFEYEAQGNSLLNMISTVDRSRYEVWALISSTRNFADYVIAPFKLVWRFDGDRTVFCVVRCDIWADLMPSDFIKWYCQEDICCFPCRVPWVDILYALERRGEASAVVGLPSTDQNSYCWNHLRTFITFHLGRDSRHLDGLKL